MCQSVAMRQHTASKTSGALLELGVVSNAKSRTLMPAAWRLLMRSSGVCSSCSMWMSYAISVAAGEGVEMWVGLASGDDTGFKSDILQSRGLLTW